MKIARGRELLTLEQRENFMKIPEEDWALGSYYTFSKEDLELINKHRRDEKSYFENEDNIGFIVTILFELLESFNNGETKYENTIHCIFEQILNSFVDEFIVTGKQIGRAHV